MTETIVRISLSGDLMLGRTFIQPKNTEYDATR